MLAEKDNFSKQLAAQEAGFKDKQIENHMRTKLLSYNWADSFLPVKDALIKAAIIDIKSQPYLYELENDGQVAIRQEKDGVKHNVFEGENILTLDKMLDKAVDSFVKKSNADPDKTQPPKPSGNPQPIVTPVNNGVETLADRRKRMAAAQ